MQLESNYVGYIVIDETMTVLMFEEALFSYLAQLSQNISSCFKTKNIEGINNQLELMNISTGMVCRLKNGDYMIFLEDKFAFIESEIEVLTIIGVELVFFPDYLNRQNG